jgi:prepilin-type N-terminal cleavage/methylation domain-containing protein
MLVARSRADFSRRDEGFTLLEILFVIGILSVLILLGMRVMEGQEQRSRTERAGQELQSVMQAAIYYHSINNAWPNENSKSDCTSELSDTSFAHYYLPKNADGEEEKSTFGTYYCWREHAVDGSDTENAALFDVYLPIKGKDACQIAHKIAGTVPNAHAVAALEEGGNDECGNEREYFVRAQVVPSAQSIREKSGQTFRAIGQCVPETAPVCTDDGEFSESSTTCCHVSDSNPTQYKIHFPSCDLGQTQKIIYLPAFITYMNSKGAAPYTPLKIYDRDYIHTTIDSVGNPTASRSSNPEPSCGQYGNELVCTLTLGVGVKTQNSGVIDTINATATTTLNNAYNAGSVGAVYVASCIDSKNK